MRLTRDEAVTLTPDCRPWARRSVGSDVAERTSRRSGQAAATTVGEPTGRIDLDLDDGSQHPAMATLKDAFARGRRVHLRYYVATRDESTERDVDIMRILNLDAQWYVEGYCHRAEDVRLFRLDRIEDVSVLDVDGTPPRPTPTADLDDVFVPGENDLTVVIEASRWAAWIADYYPNEGVERRPDGSLRVTLKVADPALVRRPRAAPRGRGPGRRAARAGRRRRRRGARRPRGLRPPAEPRPSAARAAASGIRATMVHMSVAWRLRATAQVRFTRRTYAGHLQHRGCTMTVPIRTGLRRGDVTMPNLGAPELIIIAVVLIALFGWKKLPDMARSLGRSARVFKSEVDELKKDGKPVPSDASQTTVPGDVVDADAERRAAEARLADAERRAAEARAEADRLRAASPTTTPTSASTSTTDGDIRRDTTF